MQYPDEDFSRWRQVLQILPSHSILCQAPIPAHSQYLVLLLTITYSSPTCQTGSILLQRHFFSLISSHAFYSSTFKMDGMDPLLPPTHLLGSSNSFSTREGKPGANGNPSTVPQDMRAAGRPRCWQQDQSAALDSGER